MSLTLLIITTSFTLSRVSFRKYELSDIHFITFQFYKDGKKLAEVPAESKEFVVSKLNRHTIYNFKVAAKYSNGELSAKESKTIRTAR